MNLSLQWEETPLHKAAAAAAAVPLEDGESVVKTIQTLLETGNSDPEARTLVSLRDVCYEKSWSCCLLPRQFCLFASIFSADLI